MIVLGIDVGLAITGWAVLDVLKPGKIAVMDYGYLETKSTRPLQDRLNYIYIKLKEIIVKYNPQKIGIEELYFHATGSGLPRYSKSIIATSQSRGLIFLLAAQHNIHINEYNAKTIKLTATGYGNAEKQQVQFTIKHILQLKELPKPDDVSDALAIAYVTGIDNDSIFRRNN